MGPVLYGVRQSGMEIYFTAKGIVYRHRKIMRLEGKKEVEKHGKKNEEEPVQVCEDVTMHWVNPNLSVKVTSSRSVKNQFTYSNLRDNTGRSSLKAQAFQEIVYQNLYPGIDVDYVFSPGKPGIKYTVTVHPGADPSLLQMEYEHMQSLIKDADGNCIIRTSFGPIIDEAPAPAYTKTQFISCIFKTNGNRVGFEVGNYDHTQTLVIDPWIKTPPFPTQNKAYDIDWDYQGNVYIYGGTYPYRLCKLNASGTILWTFSGTGIGDSLHLDYGDFAIDRSTGTAFLSEGFNLNGARILKVSTAGIQLALSANCTDAGEFWRIAFNSCTRKGVVACGCNSCASSTLNAEAATFDYNLTTFHPVNILSPYSLDSAYTFVDNSLLSIDDTSVYIHTCDYASSSGVDGIVKCPVAT
ncbi:MAG TPA: hypothetical protein VNZ86_10800, partial [Bacteroidia bacterium]|nr:hypothetical protein [Bacteroidia bacterium]